MVKGYWSTKDLCERYGRSARTIFRWMNRKDHPFPAAKYKPAGCNNLWAIDEVEAWENGPASAEGSTEKQEIAA